MHISRSAPPASPPPVPGKTAAYIASWLKVLKDDPKAIFTAASKAQQAADWMHAQQPHAEEVAA